MMEEIIRLAKNLELPFYSPLVPVKNGAILCHIRKIPFTGWRWLDVVTFSTFQALNRHNLAILARRLKLCL